MGYTTFQNDLERGKVGEETIDRYYTNKFDRIEQVSVREEIDKGIDRIFYHNGQRITVEYKTDEASKRTGNIFVETSVNYQSGIVDGWAKRSTCDVFMILAGSGKAQGLYLIKNENLKEALPLWQADFRTRKSIVSRNGSQEWWATGVCVPIMEFGRYCFKFIPEQELKGV